MSICSLCMRYVVVMLNSARTVVLSAMYVVVFEGSRFLCGNAEHRAFCDVNSPLMSLFVSVTHF